MSEEKELNTSDKLDQAFAKERQDISEYIKNNITDKMNKIEHIADVQVHLLSQRQRLVDRANEMRASIRKKNKNLHGIKKQKYRYYKLDYDIKLTDYEIKNHIEADIEDSINIIKLIENQVLYYKETTETLDKCVYMIKYLIEVKKYLSGNF